MTKPIEDGWANAPGENDWGRRVFSRGLTRLVPVRASRSLQAGRLRSQHQRSQHQRLRSQTSNVQRSMTNSRGLDPHGVDQGPVCDSNLENDSFCYAGTLVTRKRYPLPPRRVVTIPASAPIVVPTAIVVAIQTISPFNHVQFTPNLSPLR